MTRKDKHADKEWRQAVIDSKAMGFPIIPPYARRKQKERYVKLKAMAYSILVAGLLFTMFVLATN